MQRPLADEIRPKTLNDVVGQRHLLAPGAVLRRLIESGTDANMVFYGPSGTGKTTIANIAIAITINNTTATPVGKFNREFVVSNIALRLLSFAEFALYKRFA